MTVNSAVSWILFLPLLSKKSGSKCLPDNLEITTDFSSHFAGRRAMFRELYFTKFQQLVRHLAIIRARDISGLQHGVCAHVEFLVARFHKITFVSVSVKTKYR